MDATLREHVRAYYARHPPPPELLDRLAALAEPGGLPREGRSPLGRAGLYAAALAVVVLACVAAALVGRHVGLRGDSPAVALGRQLALNHTHPPTVELSDATYAEVAALLADLDFPLVEPARLRGAQFTITGARYCVLRDHLAAQLELHDPVGRRYSLFAVRRGPTFEAVPEGVLTVAGRVRVEVWSEGGLLYALAGGTTRREPAGSGIGIVS